MNPIQMFINRELAKAAVNGQPISHKDLTEAGSDTQPLDSISFEALPDDPLSIAKGLSVALGIVPAASFQDVADPIPEGFHRVDDYPAERGFPNGKREVARDIQPVVFSD